MPRLAFSFPFLWSVTLTSIAIGVMAWISLYSEEMLVFSVLIIIGLMVRVGIHFFDKSRIVSAGREKQGRKVSVTWRPIAPGWLFESGERHYKVTFIDLAGKKITKFCKTGVFTGIFWRN